MVRIRRAAGAGAAGRSGRGLYHDMHRVSGPCKLPGSPTAPHEMRSEKMHQAIALAVEGSGKVAAG